MNQEKIGKFILECRKNKKLTQAELAEKLGVTDKSIGNWENGRNMPDLSLFKPLCDVLGITINEFLSGEHIKEKYQEKFEENIINTIDYSTKKINLIRNNLGFILLFLGIFISFTAMSIFPSDSSWGSIYSVFGGIISTVGISRLVKNLSHIKRLLINYGYFVLYVILLFIMDYVSVVSYKQIPRFCTIKRYENNVYECENPFYNVFRINSNTSAEYTIVDTKKEYNVHTIPNVPFNRSISGIDNIIKYKNKYIGNNSNTANLVKSLPLSEYGSVIEIDSKNLGLTIDYHITDWYINEDMYLEKSLIYNAASIFMLIDNVESIKYNFSGKTYYVDRNTFTKVYPQYKKINKDTFNKYVESMINDISFIKEIFNKTIKEQ